MVVVAEVPLVLLPEGVRVDGGRVAGAGDGVLGEGLVAGTAGGGLPGRSVAAAAPPPARTRHAPVASAASRRRRTRLPRSAMCAIGAGLALVCPESAACRNND